MMISRPVRRSPLAEMAARLPANASVLDVGCGNFRRIHRNLARARDDISVVGLERFEDATVTGPSPIYEPCRTERFKRIACDVERERFPFEDGVFDGAFLSHVIEHVTEKRRVLEEIHRTLKPDGLLYVETPGPVSLTLRRPAWLTRTEGDTINFYDDPTHVGTPYSAESLRELLLHADFSVVAEGPFQQLGLWGTPVYLLMMAAGALPVLSAPARTTLYSTGIRNLTGWSISVLAQK